MNKTLLAAACVVCFTRFTGQTVIFSDNFDSVTAGLGVMEQNASWSTWDGSAGADAEVSADYAFSGENSALIQGTSVDLVLPIGPYTSGKYDLKFKMLVTNGGAYFNLLHQWASDSPNYEWACDIFFTGTGVVTWITGSVENGSVTVNLLEWFDVQVTADLDNDIGKIYINGEVVNEWQWSLDNANGAAGQNQLMAADFFGTNADTGEGLYYIDDVQLIESTGVYTDEILPALIQCYPNPTSDNLIVSVNANGNNALLTLTDVNGKMVLSDRLVTGNNTIQLKTLAEGVYIAKVMVNNQIIIERIVKQ